MILNIFLVALATFVGATPIPSLDVENRIINGSAVLITQFPHQVSLRYSSGFHFCGGAIVSDRWILTAAHCTSDTGDDEIFVWVGTSYLNRDGTGIRSSRIINHPNYRRENLNNDVALIQTSQRIPIDNVRVKAIHIASHTTWEGATVTITGWGFTEPGWNTPNQLQRLDKNVISNDDCRRRLSPHQAFVPDSKICTMAGSHQGMCQGDSGGPLIEGGWLVGVASFGYCAKGLPDGFDRVAHHHAWINANMR